MQRATGSGPIVAAMLPSPRQPCFPSSGPGVPGPAAVGSTRAAVPFSVGTETEIPPGGIASSHLPHPRLRRRPAPTGRGGKSPSMSKAPGCAVSVAAKEPRRRAAPRPRPIAWPRGPRCRMPPCLKRPPSPRNTARQNQPRAGGGGPARLGCATGDIGDTLDRGHGLHILSPNSLEFMEMFIS